MGHWKLLDLAPDADERSIKRAYARLLKTTRPDENPDDFQRLREAYESALAQARWRAAANEPDEPEEQRDEVREAFSYEPIAPAAPEVQPVAPLDALVDDTPFEAFTFIEPLDPVEPVVYPPEPSFEQMYQWMVEGKERQVHEGLQVWLASDWLMPFERRRQFKLHIFGWFESLQSWSPAFFDSVCQLMGWDEAKGDLPCERVRWTALIRRCEALAFTESVRAELAQYDEGQFRGRAAALLLQPMSDRQRRQLADSFAPAEWQRFTQLAQAFEYRHPDVPETPDLIPLDNWRDWLPAHSYRSVYLFLWVALSLAAIVSARIGAPQTLDLVTVFLLPLLVPVVMWLGMKAYGVWMMAAVAAGKLDVAISQRLLPARWYRQGAGLLLLRHFLPGLAPAALSYVWTEKAPALQWVTPVVVFIGTLYFTNAALRGGAPSLGARLVQKLKQNVARLPWHFLKSEAMIAVIAVVGTAISVYWHLKGSL